ncbi:MAG: nickel-dependent hydrogenase large subunit [Firmicutes bacterium]|nr:nickel-dependent hydrogenase large subunit [Bacillota bacterium]
MAQRVMIDPITRVEGHMSAEIYVENGEVVDAKVSSTLFRGLEKIFEGRDPRDMPYYTQRICGFCPVPHSVASSAALRDANPVEVPYNGRKLTNMILAADYLMDHIRHFYFLVVPDFTKMPEVSPYIPYPTKDYRLPPDVNAKIVEHYLEALDVQRRSDTMVATFAGKAPHIHGIFPGGTSMPPHTYRVIKYRSHALELVEFIRTRMVPDMEAFAKYYPDHFEFGKGYENFLSVGLFQQSENLQDRVIKPGIMVDGEIRNFDIRSLREGVTEDISHAWYEEGPEDTKPINSTVDPAYGKEGAYTWVKAPRLNGKPMETGPLARMWITGDYRNGISTMDRLFARVVETLKIAEYCSTWATELKPGEPHIARWEVPDEGYGAGLVEAVRGTLGHWIKIEGGKVAKYQVITPTVWNGSPRDKNGQRGPMEESLIGIPVENPEHPIEVVRTIHSFDPCNACAVQVITPKGPLKKFRVY